MNKKRWIKEDIEYLKSNYLLLTNREIAEYLNISIKRVEHKLNRLNLSRPVELYPEKEICEDYLSGKYTLGLLAIKYHVTLKIIQGILNRNKIKRIKNSGNKRKYKFNQHYFDNITDENKAYWLGFLFADGSICNDKTTLTLIEEDKYILESFQKDLEHTGKLRFININSKHPNRQNQYALELCSTYLSNKLFDIGCVRNKSLVLEPSKINFTDSLKRHWIRGIWDGDGYVGLSKDKYLRITLVGTYEIIKYIENHLYAQFKFYGCINQPKINKNTYTLTYHTKKAILVYKYLYNDCKHKLYRKSKYLQYFL